MFNKILIANRGEIALRILRAAHELDIKTVAVYSEVDSNLEHLKLTDEKICIGTADPHDSYLNMHAILKAARETKVDAIHPGYGFLAENSDFIKQVHNEGFIFIGPSMETMSLIPNKIASIVKMQALGIPCIPGSNAALMDNDEFNFKLAHELGFPVIIKAAKGGGGYAINVAHSPASLLKVIRLTQEQAAKFFGDPSVYMEKFLDDCRHIEIQLLSDYKGHVIYLAERDSSMQRNKRKIIDESPAPDISNAMLIEINEKCVQVLKELKITGVATFEFLLANDKFYFLEINPRIQVGHTVTEIVSNIDLVKEQIKMAAGEELTIQQQDVRVNGNAIQCRIFAEDQRTATPSSGTIKLFHAPSGPGVRVDSHLYSGYTVPVEYDHLLAKIITYNTTREATINRMRNALDEVIINGVITNLPLLQSILYDEGYLNTKFTTDYLEKKLGPIAKF